MRAVVVAIAVLFALVLCELVTHLSLRNNANFRDTAAYYSHSEETGKSEGGNWLGNNEPHPYFGYVTTHAGTLASNNFGFNDPESFPYRRRSANEYVIAVLGGSVALSWGSWIQGGGRDSFLSLLRARNPAMAKRNIVILNMALGGFKQPQQLYVASYFLESADAFVNLEGFNELRAYSNQPLIPVEYPTAAYLFFWKSSAADRASFLLRAYSGASRTLFSVGKMHPWLGGSALYYLAAKCMKDLSNSRSAAIAESVRAAYKQELAAPGRAFFDEASARVDARDAAVAAWERFALQEQRLLSSYGKKVFFFLQPNQYLAGSKPLSPWEQEHAVVADYSSQARDMMFLPPAVERMKKKKVNIFDLTQIFSGDKETIYIDSCCHVNNAGNEILSRAILEKMAGALR